MKEGMRAKFVRILCHWSLSEDLIEEVVLGEEHNTFIGFFKSRVSRGEHTYGATYISVRVAPKGRRRKKKSQNLHT